MMKYSDEQVSCCPPVALIIRALTKLYNGEGNGNPLQYSCLENPMDEEAW